MRSPTFLVVDPAHFEVSYSINPWMQPGLWGVDPVGQRQAARTAFSGLTSALLSAGAAVEVLTGVPGAPDLVFPANAGVVLGGRATLARFRHPERQVEEPVFRAAFEALKARGMIDEIVALPDGCVQEGAGDFIWDAYRDLFWAGYGPRSNRRGLDAVAEVFGRPTVALELATEQFYHLDTCFCPLPGGEVMYYPPSFTAAGRRAIKDHVAKDLLIEASGEDAARFCVNAVAFDRTVVMAEAADRLRGVLLQRGYRLMEVDLAPFILSGGGAYCMTLRLDRASIPALALPELSLPELSLPEHSLQEPAE
jgi:N-dimethylarginine dimethylaminohydrolase